MSAAAGLIKASAPARIKAATIVVFRMEVSLNSLQLVGLIVMANLLTFAFAFSIARFKRGPQPWYTYALILLVLAFAGYGLATPPAEELIVLQQSSSGG